jgi:hypothetical protein
MSVALLSLFIAARERGKRGIQICATVLESWKVFSYVDVCQEALKKG